MPSQGRQRGWKCYVTPAFSGIPNANRVGAKNQQWSQTKGNKIRIGCLTRAFSGAQKRAEMLRYPCILGDPQRQPRGAKISSGPNKGKQNEKWLPHPCLLVGPKEGGNATPPLHSRGSTTPRAGGKKTIVVPNKGKQFKKWLPHPCLLRGQKLGGNATSTPPSRGPKRGRKCYATPAFSGIPNAKHREQKISSGPKQRGTKSEVAETSVMHVLQTPIPSRSMRYTVVT